MANSLAMITKQQIRTNYIEKISIKHGAKKTNYYQISKTFLEAFGQLSGHDHKKNIRINCIEETRLQKVGNNLLRYQKVIANFWPILWP